eukprot:CAMPEP_0170965182 /NCGR_PEP_ID=MMETSP0735-20130129/40800_1 /TAXON_ID=186038 /ORGANISM="Fragilariopsis kerguelensis, Strain L26-C5" /LENGTH=106 /DNA_ID=CAMNT_0011382551 /DNA_START=461 /DNA_END=778 /DNA_ORIENTATION=-
MVKCNHRDVPDHTKYWDCWDIPWEGSTGPVRSDPLARFQWSGVVRADIVFSFGKPVRPVLWVGVDSTRLGVDLSSASASASGGSIVVVVVVLLALVVVTGVASFLP